MNCTRCAPDFLNANLLEIVKVHRVELFSHPMLRGGRLSADWLIFLFRTYWYWRMVGRRPRPVVSPGQIFLYLAAFIIRFQFAFV
jgi:hypothetical protein